MHERADLIDERTRFEDAYRQHGARLWRSMLLFTGDPEVASDAVAEAFAQAIRRGTDVESVEAWVARAAYRIAAGEMQSRRRSGYPIVDTPYEMPERVHELAAALATLSPKQRAAAVLHFRDRYTLAEVAEINGSTPSAVSVHLDRAKKKLRALLEETDA